VPGILPNDGDDQKHWWGHLVAAGEDKFIYQCQQSELSQQELHLFDWNTMAWSRLPSSPLQTQGFHVFFEQPGANKLILSGGHTHMLQVIAYVNLLEVYPYNLAHLMISLVKNNVR
jgi:hypothetical protein